MFSVFPLELRGPFFSARPEKEAKGAVLYGQRRHWYVFIPL